MFRVPIITAWARVHGGDEHEFCRKDQALSRAGDMDQAGFHGLAERLKRPFLKFRYFVQKKNAMMGEADLPGFGFEPPPISAIWDDVW